MSINLLNMPFFLKITLKTHVKMNLLNFNEDFNPKMKLTVIHIKAVSDCQFPITTGIIRFPFGHFHTTQSEYTG